MMSSGAFSTFSRSPTSSIPVGNSRIRPRPGDWTRYDRSPNAKEFKISEMINPDGSVTVRKRIMNPDGSSLIAQEEYSSLDNRILNKPDSATYEDDTTPLLQRSSSYSESTPTRTLWSSDQSGNGSAFSLHSKAKLPMDYSFSTARNTDKSVPSQGPFHEETYWTADETESSSNISSIPFEGSFEESKILGLQRPINPVPFEQNKNTDSSVLSIHTLVVNDTDVSAISGDSMGYPCRDTSTELHEPSNIDSHEDSREAAPVETDDDSLWSLLHDDLLTEKTATSQTREIQTSSKELHPSQNSISIVDPTPATRRIDRSITPPPPPTTTTTTTTTKTASASIPIHSNSSQGNLVILKQANVIEKPKPQVKYYADPKVSRRGEGPRAQTKREMYSLPALVEESTDTQPEGEDQQIVFTVRKKSLDDRIGVFVGVCQLPCGPRLVVTKVSSNGKFAESPIEKGDIVVSINGKDFLNNPNSEEALELVRQAKDRITFVVSKGGEDSSANMSNDDFSIPNFPYRHVSEVVQPGGSKIVNREIKNDDGSLTVLMEFFDSSGQKQKQTTRRRWVSPDGSGSDISLASLSLNGELVILVKKADPKQKVGLKLQRKRSHRGQDMLVVSQVFPSGLFARTPLSVGDQILSINGVDFHEKGDPSDAAVIFANAKEDVRIRAWKSREWIERRQRRLAQTRHLVETFTIPAPKGTSYTFDDSSYGGSIQGYESSKKLTLSNIPTLERRDFGVEMQHTHFGTLLVAKGVSPSGRVAASGLQNGDVILAINGFDLRNDPDVDYAMTLINALDRSIEIEYQRVEDRLEEEAAKVQTQESFSADGTKCIRTETRNPDGSIFVKVEQIGPAIPVDVTLGERGNTTRKSENRDIIGLDGNPSQKAILASVVSDSQPVFVTARKASPSQDIGISLEVSGGRLYVKSISPNGLLVGKPILPGDRIQSINGHDFGTNPSVRKAMAIIAKSSTNVSFEVLKSSQEKGKSPEPTTKRRLQRLCCNKRKTHNSHRDS